MGAAEGKQVGQTSWSGAYKEVAYHNEDTPLGELKVVGSPLGTHNSVRGISTSRVKDGFCTNCTHNKPSAELTECNFVGFN